MIVEEKKLFDAKRRDDQCNHCSLRRAVHVLWPYEKVFELWQRCLKRGQKNAPLPSAEEVFPWQIKEPLLVLYHDSEPYDVCGPQSYAFPDVKVWA